jgi:dTDP-4-dehydrorhamnose 3,5-epimerase
LRVSSTALPGVMLVEAAPHADARGLFARTYDRGAFAAAGLPTEWPQCNISWNRARGTLRGMHFQHPPFAEPKLVRCTRGHVFDVTIDLRRDSPAFRRWVGVELCWQRRNAMFIPSGCAHGFLTLEDDCEIFYMMGAEYRPEAAGGLRWNDPAIAVEWPFAPVGISDRDATWPDVAP